MARTIRKRNSKHILPKLALELRENFTIDPSDQKLDVLLETVMPWRSTFRASTWGKLLESDFFLKWLSMLHLWLTSEQVNLEEVGQWYEWWKHQVFPAEVLEMEGVRKGFKAGLDLMSKAADYTDQGISLSKLPAPMTGPQRPVSKPVRAPKKEVTKPVAREIRETTFKDVLEDLCAENSLLLVPLRTADEATGKALFRITASADGKGGVTGYIGDGDVLWLQTKRQGPYEPVGLDKIVPLAERR
jgi:tuftelin-interacting protein 11